jgi:hypothetical protein
VMDECEVLEGCFICGDRGYNRNPSTWACLICDVEWSGPRAWLPRNWPGSYAYYRRSREAVEASFAETYDVEFVDFRNPDAPHSPA